MLIRDPRMECSTDAGQFLAYQEILSVFFRERPALVNCPPGMLEWIVVSNVLYQEACNAVKYECQGYCLTRLDEKFSFIAGAAGTVRPSPEKIKQQR